MYGGLDCSLKTVDTIDKIGYEPIKKSVQNRPLCRETVNFMRCHGHLCCVNGL